ncbi:sensor histidine kinase [Streptomyces bluensis]|uniref:sensor histidine kinase n=1 Tax=Streptomyces bluensis TaxID=33897 RepID=UPI003329D610
MRMPGGWWRSKSTPAKVETYTRWTYHFFAVFEVMVFGLPVLVQVPLRFSGWLFAALCGHALLSTATASRAVDWTRGRREQPLRLMGTLGAVTALFAAATLLVTDALPADSESLGALGSLATGAMGVGVGTITLGMRRRRWMAALVAGFAVGCLALALLLHAAPDDAVVAALALMLFPGFMAFAAAFSVWLLNAVYELDEARETRARLAVAEERLRFGRDLHDVIGRNLAVIALKSELAVQLARRERPEAVEQMIEVQRIAQESQREVRDVVRGYREADLGVELTGARGVLNAAGIACEVRGETAGLPAEVQSALGWVVREATTNVLRHGDAARCDVGIRVLEGRVVLTVENDGAESGGAESGGAESGGAESGGAESGGVGNEGVENEGPANRGAAGAPLEGRGSGLAGLRERLAAVDGTLEAGRVRKGVFRVVAEVPLTVNEATA